MPSIQRPGSTTPSLPLLPTAEVVRRIEDRLGQPRGLPRRLEKPNLPAVRDAVARLLDVLVSAMPEVRAVAGRTPQAPDIALRALLRSYRSFQALRHRRREEAALLLVDCWLEEALQGEAEAPAGEGGEGAEGGEGGDDRRAAADSPGTRLREVRRELAELMARHRTGAEEDEAGGDSGEWMVLYTQAVGEAMAQRLTEGRVRSALRALMTHLELGQDEVGRIFRVSGETVRRWERGKTGIPAEREAAILATETALNRLLAVFRPERLPLVVRREADLFDGESALEWILRGRIADVVDRYETAFLYQA